MLRNLACVLTVGAVALGVGCIAGLMLGGAVAANIWLWHWIISVIF